MTFEQYLGRNIYVDRELLKNNEEIINYVTKNYRLTEQEVMEVISVLLKWGKYEREENE